MPSARAVYCTQNKHTSISIHTFVRYAKEVSGDEAMHWFSLFRQKNFALHGTGLHFFEAINDISSDAESREEQNGASRFVIEGKRRRPSYGRFSKRMQAKKNKNNFFCYFELF